MSVPNPACCAGAFRRVGMLCAAVLVAAALAACSSTIDPAAQSSAPASAAAAASAKNAPKAFPPEQPGLAPGDTAWFVIVALARTENDPKLASAQRSVTDVGYSGVEVFQVPDCLDGLRQGLKLQAGDYYGVALKFADAATAQKFVDAYQPGVVGTVQVVNKCYDAAY